VNISCPVPLSKTPFSFPLLGIGGNVAEAEESRAHIVDIFVGVLQTGFPTDFSQKL
jgi:hypothetical protein